MLSMMALQMVLATTGELAAQDVQQVEVCDTGQAALMQKATTLRSNVRVFSEKSSNAAVDVGPSFAQFSTIAPSDGLQFFMESHLEERQAHVAPSNIGVWDKLEDMTLQDLQQARFEPPLRLEEAAAQTAPSQRTAPACGVLWFYHIGKCAG